MHLCHLNLPQTFFLQKITWVEIMTIFCHNLSHYTLPTPAPHQWRFPVVSVGTLSPWLIQTGTFSELIPSGRLQVGCFFWILVTYPGSPPRLGIFWGDTNRFGVHYLVNGRCWGWAYQICFCVTKIVGKLYRRQGANLMSVCWLRDVYERNIWLVRESMANI